MLCNYEFCFAFASQKIPLVYTSLFSVLKTTYYKAKKCLEICYKCNEDKGDDYIFVPFILSGF